MTGYMAEIIAAVRPGATTPATGDSAAADATSAAGPATGLLRLSVFPRTALTRLEGHLSQFTSHGGEAAAMFPSVAQAAAELEAAKLATADLRAVAAAAAACVTAGSAYVASTGALAAGAAAELLRNHGIDAASRIELPRDLMTPQEAARPWGTVMSPKNVSPPAAAALAARWALLTTEQRTAARAVAALKQWLAETDVDFDAPPPPAGADTSDATASSNASAGSGAVGVAGRVGSVSFLAELQSARKTRRSVMDYTLGDGGPLAVLFGGGAHGQDAAQQAMKLRQQWAQKVEAERGVVMVGPRVDPLFFTQKDAYKVSIAVFHN